MKTLEFLHLKNYPVFEQLKIEEALLRADKRAFCLINEGSVESIVLSNSSKPQELIDKTFIQSKNIPVIKRFTGGGCVFVDKNTLLSAAAGQMRKPSKQRRRRSKLGGLPIHQAREQFERDYLVELLKRHDQNVSAAARTARIHRQSLHRLLKKHEIRSADASDPSH